MYDILSQKGNKNQNETAIPPYSSQNGQSRKQATNAGEDAEKGTLIHCWWEGKLVQPLSVWRVLKKLKIVLNM
jgi:hypothetical protein